MLLATDSDPNIACHCLCVLCCNFIIFLGQNSRIVVFIAVEAAM